MTGSKATRSARVRAGVFTKRAYDVAEASDGTRVLVDGLWPRGLRKDKARVDLWMKEIAPSAELRRWFHHDPTRWRAFRQRYLNELRGKAEIVDELRRLAARGAVTLLFASSDVDHNNAVVLQGLLRKHG